VHTQPCVLGANLLRIQVTGLCWRWSDLHRRLGSARPRSAAARSAFTPVVTRPQCVNCCVNPWREGFAHRLGARSTARKRVDRHLTRAFHGVVSQTGHPDGCDQPKVVTASGHRWVSILDQRQSVDTWADTGSFRPKADFRQ
jgi:hypothetical protein